MSDGHESDWSDWSDEEDGWEDEEDDGDDLIFYDDDDDDEASWTPEGGWQKLDNATVDSSRKDGDVEDVVRGDARDSAGVVSERSERQ